MLNAAMTSSGVRALVPKFHGVVSVSQVLNATRDDVSDKYLLDCCFAIEFLTGTFRKLFISGKPIVSVAECGRVVHTLEDVGIRYVIDSSVRIDPTEQKIEKIIDFATRDAYLEEENNRLFGS